MILKITRGDDFAFIDNEGEVLHAVKVTGNKEAIVRSLDNILNIQTSLVHKGEVQTVPSDLLIRIGDSPVEINKAKDKYFKEHFIGQLKLMGFTVEVIKE